MLKVTIEFDDREERRLKEFMRRDSDWMDGKFDLDNSELLKHKLEANWLKDKITLELKDIPF